MSRQHAAAAILFIALAVLMTWPLALNLDRAVSDPGDPYVNTWILDWDWWATLHHPLSLFHANALHPAQYTLAFSENLYGIALLLFPLRLLGLSPITSYNVAMLLGFAFSGFGAYLLGKRLTGCWSAGLAAGVFYAFVPFRFTHIGHIQHVWGGWLPLLLLGLLWYADAPSPRRAAAFGAVFLMNGLTNIHNLFFGTFAIAVTAVLLLPRRAWRDLAIAVAVAAVVLAPFLYPYYAASKLYGAQRTAEESYQFSAIPSDWLPGAVEPERMLYPGAIALTCGVAALFLRRARPKVALAFLWIAIGFAGSLGMHFEFHRFLFGAVPGFQAIRAPARWAVIAYVGLAIAVALVTAAIARRNRWLAYALPVVLLVELHRAPIRWYMSVPEPPAVYRWLAEGRTPIVELPIDSLGGEYGYYLRSTVHHRPMINGAAGTPVKKELSAKWWASPIGDDFVEALAKAGVDLMIVHADRMGEKSAEVREWLRRELDRGRISFVRRFDAGADGDWVFRLGTAAGRPRDPRVERFLAGKPTCGDSTHGALDVPSGHEPLGESAMFSGWAISPHGIRRVDLLFNNRTVRIPATLRPPVIAADRCPSYPFVRFTAQFPRRPAGVWVDTDVQVDVVDGRGEVISYESRWLRWD